MNLLSASWFGSCQKPTKPTLVRFTSDRISSHWNGVKYHVNQVDNQDVGEDETHWQELQGLPEALPSVFHV